MKLWHVIGIVIMGLLFSYPNQKVPPTQQNEERQEEQSVEEAMSTTHRVVYRYRSGEEDVADIYWLNKAAAFALKNGSPYFNVLEQKITQNRVDGIIELTSDATKAQYDAREIRDLALP